MTKLLVKIVGRNTKRNILTRHKKNYSVRTLYCPIAPTSQHVRKLTSTCILQKTLLIQAKDCLQVTILSSNSCWFLFNAMTLTEGAQRPKCIGNQNFGCDIVSGKD